MARNIALVLVHGIGDQKDGETLASFAENLKRAYPDAEVVRGNGTVVRDCREDYRALSEDGVRELHLRENAWQVCIYEAYWADILSGPTVADSFNKYLLEEITWFPLLNLKYGLWHDAMYSRLRVYGFTGILAVLEAMATFILEVLPASLLDETVADVWNYVHSFRDRNIIKNSPIRGTAIKIIARVKDVLHKAQQDGCTELQIIAHSLGTVVTHHALTNMSTISTLSTAPLPITRLYTIGSPLEKVLFFWPKVLNRALSKAPVRGAGVTVHPDFKWLNFYSPFDLVSGRLKHFNFWGDVENARVWGLGGLHNAHIEYRKHPKFINTVAAALGGERQHVVNSWWNRIVHLGKAIASDVATPLVVVFLFVLGFALTFGFFVLFGGCIGAVLYGLAGWWFLNPVMGWLFEFDPGFWDYVQGWAMFSPALMIVLFPFLFIKDGYYGGVRKHRWFNEDLS